jgi:uncharacterized YceG family protein
VAEGHDRTAEEREAARRERERRRAGIFNAPDEALPPIVRRSAAEPPPTVEHDVVAHEFDDDHDDHDDANPGYADEPPEVERPSGTRRVSRLRSDALGARPRPPRERPPRSPSSVRRPPAEGRRRPVAGPRARKHSWLGRGVVVLVLVLAVALAWFAVKLYQPFGTSPHGRVTVVIPAHSGAHQVGDLLARQGVVPSGLFFEFRATLSGERGKLRSGTYQLQQGMSYSAVLSKLTTVPPAARTSPLTIAEGHTRQYVSALLRRQGIKGNYLAATRRSPLLSPQAYGAPRSVSTLEGFLFPDTFRLVDPIKVSALVDDQLRDFKQRLAGVDLSYARSKHLTAYDVLTIASMIEAEAAAPRDRPLIASVIYNRLADGMMLQFDSTTRYATGNFTGALTVSQLHSPSPYNTHTHLGLPPTPIDSPGLAAIQAAAHPAHTDYLYFFTKPCNAGASVYTSTYSRFEYLLAVDRRTHC